MKNLVKKNQLMITALAIMIAIAGYLQFAGTNLEEEYLTVEDGNAVNAVDSPGVITDNYTASNVADGTELDGLLDLSQEDLMTDIESLDSDVDILMEDYLEDGMQVIGQTAQATPDEGEIPGEAVFTSTNGMIVLSDAKLLKEQTRAKNKETLMQIINSDRLSDVQKQEAVDNMIAMAVNAEKESAAEILLEAKGFSDVVVSIGDGEADVFVNAIELSEAQRAQIEDIVKRKTDIPAEKVVISTVVE